MITTPTPEAGTLAAQRLNLGLGLRTSVSDQPRTGFCGVGTCGECRVTNSDGSQTLSCLTSPSATVEENRALSELIEAEVAIIGAGPGGLTVARILGDAGVSCVVIDDGIAAGGRVDTGHGTRMSWAASSIIGGALHAANVRHLQGTKVIDVRQGDIITESAQGVTKVRATTTVIATGAREFAHPRPGWTSPNVFTAGGLQVMIKQGLNVRGASLVFAGTGPLLLAAATTAVNAGAATVRVVERVDWRTLARFGIQLMRYPDRLQQAFGMLSALRKCAFTTSATLTRIDGTIRLLARIERDGHAQRIDADFIGLSDALLPNVDLARSLGCETSDAIPFPAIATNAQGRTSQANVFAIGEATGVGGRAKAIAQAEAVAQTILGRSIAPALVSRVNAELAYAATLQEMFPLRGEPLVDDQTIICRCEDVSWSEVCSAKSWREAKLQTRCGMGYCQGRTCGPALAVLKEFRTADQRTPLFPARLDSLSQQLDYQA